MRFLKIVQDSTASHSVIDFSDLILYPNWGCFDRRRWVFSQCEKHFFGRIFNTKVKWVDFDALQIISKRSALHNEVQQKAQKIFFFPTPISLMPLSKVWPIRFQQCVFNCYCSLCIWMSSDVRSHCEQW